MQDKVLHQDQAKEVEYSDYHQLYCRLKNFHDHSVSVKLTVVYVYDRNSSKLYEDIVENGREERLDKCAQQQRGHSRDHLKAKPTTAAVQPAAAVECADDLALIIMRFCEEKIALTIEVATYFVTRVMDTIGISIEQVFNEIRVLTSS